MDCSYTAGRYAERMAQETSQAGLTDLNIELHTTSNCTLGHLPRETELMFAQNLDTNVHSTFTRNNQKLEAAQMSFTGEWLNNAPPQNPNRNQTNPNETAQQ